MKIIYKLLLLLLITSTFTSCKRIKAGESGIKVNLYGTNKGISDVREVTGMVWYNPITKSVYSVPNYVQTATYEGGDAFTHNTKDGMTVSFDLTMLYSIPEDNVIPIFKKYRKAPHHLEKTVIRTYLREAFDVVVGKFNAEELYEDRDAFLKESRDRVRAVLEKEGFIVDEVALKNSIRLPRDLIDRINDKVKAAQISRQMREEVHQAAAKADKRIEEARGKAESMRIEAIAEAESYRIKKQELNSLLIQQQFIEKWGGSFGEGNVFGNDGPLSILKN